MKTIKKIIIENFQSHEYSELEFDNGLNVIIGASDQGKSSVIRALRWVLYNEPRGADFIRVGANHVRVTIYMNDGFIVTRERTPSKNRYIVTSPDGDEQIYEGFGNSVPQEVITAHGVEKIMLDEGEEKMLHLGMQLDGPFLLSESGAVKAKAIGRLNGVHIIDAAHRDTSRDLARLQQDEKTYREQLHALQEELEQFQDLAYLENILFLVEEKQNRVQQLSTRLAKLKQLRDAMQENHRQLEIAERVLQQTEKLTDIVGLWECAVQVNERVKRLRFLREKLQSIRRELAYCAKIEQETRELERASQKVTSLQQVLNKHRLLQQMSGKWKEVNRSLALVERVLERTKDVEKGIHLYERLIRLGMKQKTLRTSYEKLRLIERDTQVVERYLTRLAEIDRAEEKLAHLTKFIDRLQRLASLRNQKAEIEERLFRADQFLKEHAREMEKQLNAYQILLKRSGTCPVCFSPIDEHTTERILEEFTGGVEDGRETRGT
ncbi:hypothetical protein DNHGIG_27130 [Collibacillus ludicampi]|uniref:Nuclease SbcCD subunit C n=1 Tax=Collibacillus ludicampi TaxID=2771369 RepID=A0AAV4LHI7_9BACL|nr:AAA family ATPase [Collibacillus ludicampi]GIM47164.1 hypothetical protein DNHGIG_27130 [Collibacillus ludicampi]